MTESSHGDKFWSTTEKMASSPGSRFSHLHANTLLQGSPLLAHRGRICSMVTRESRRVVPVSPGHDERPPKVVNMGVP